MPVKEKYKKFRIRLLQQLAFLMGICYILNPLGPQINDILHTISHGLNAPSVVIGHPQKTLSTDKIHSYHKHEKHQMSHEHGLVDFVQTLFEATQEQSQPSDSSIPENSIDKHINTYAYSETAIVQFRHSQIFISPGQNVRFGYPTLWMEPPIYVLRQMEELQNS